MKFNFRTLNLTISIRKETLERSSRFLERSSFFCTTYVLIGISIVSFIQFYSNGLGLAYNDARSHLDIGRRVVEGLKPGFAQLGSVWLPLPHFLMVPTIWNDFMWHSGLSGALQSMIAFVFAGYLIYAYLQKLGVGLFARLVGIFVFAANLNVLYMQSIAMTELLLLVTMTAGVLELLRWEKEDNFFHLVKSSFWIMLSTLIRYDGWFLLLWTGFLVILLTIRKKGYKVAEGTFLFFMTLGGAGIALWFLWNQLIFHDALYFIFGPYSARVQQQQLEQAGVLATKGNILLSLKIYLYALAYNTGAFTLVLGMIGAVMLWLERRIPASVKVVTSALLAPFVFNVLALYLGHSVLFVQGLSGDTWFNVRYGLMMMPSVAIFVGYLVHKLSHLRVVVIGLLAFVAFFSFVSYDAVTIDDARVGSSQKNVSEISSWLATNATNKKGFILISAASHDAIIFSSGLPMSRFIHEGTGKYWESATTGPENWARWIIMRTNDTNDITFKTVSKTPGFAYYSLVGTYPFADIYEIKPEYVSQLHTEPVLGKQR